MLFFFCFISYFQYLSPSILPLGHVTALHTSLSTTTQAQFVETIPREGVRFSGFLMPNCFSSEELALLKKNNIGIYHESTSSDNETLMLNSECLPSSSILTKANNFLSNRLGSDYVRAFLTYDPSGVSYLGDENASTTYYELHYRDNYLSKYSSIPVFHTVVAAHDVGTILSATFMPNCREEPSLCEMRISRKELIQIAREKGLAFNFDTTQYEATNTMLVDPQTRISIGDIFIKAGSVETGDGWAWYITKNTGIATTSKNRIGCMESLSLEVNISSGRTSSLHSYPQCMQFHGDM